MNNENIGYIPQAMDSVNIEGNLKEYSIDLFGDKYEITEVAERLDDNAQSIGYIPQAMDSVNTEENLKEYSIDLFGDKYETIEVAERLDDNAQPIGYIPQAIDEVNIEENLKEYGLDLFEDVFGDECATTEVPDRLEEDDEDIIIKLFKSFYDYRPINLFIGDNKIKEYEKIENCIVIEKFGEDIISVERLGFKPFYIKGEKDNLITKESNLSEYIQWLKSDMIKRYNNTISDDEFDGIKKYIIIDDESDKIELNSNEIYMTRKEALSRVSSKYEAVIDLTMNNCHIKFIDEDGNDCEIDVKGLGYEISSSIDWTELIYTKLEMLKEKNIIFTGLAGNEKLNKDLKLKFNANGNKNFESLAWEI